MPAYISGIVATGALTFLCALHLFVVQMTVPESETTREARLVLESLELRKTDDGKTYFLSLPVPQQVVTEHIDNALLRVHETDVVPHGGKREISLCSHGHQITVFYGCNEEVGKAALYNIHTDGKLGALKWADCTFEPEPEKLGAPNARRKNSQCWVLKIKSWPVLTELHELSKRLCLATELERAAYRSFLPHVTVAYVQDSSS